MSVKPASSNPLTTLIDPVDADLCLAFMSVLLRRRNCLRGHHFDDTGSIVVSTYAEQLNALGQEGRLEIFRLLVRAGPLGSCVDEIRRRFGMPGSTLSHHLDTLTRSGLLSARRAGRFIYYAVNWPAAARLIRFLTEDCCADMHAHLGQVAPQTADRKLPGVSRGKRKARAAR
jgi:ArsR family transcriptional regulator, arsenate/arsenite/antimonite-responsive transcriptional repressor